MQVSEPQPATAFSANRFHVDLSTQSVRLELFACEDLEDTLGGIARATKYLAGINVDDPYAPSAPLVMNVGLLSGTRVMTGLRTFFHGYSPLKVSESGASGLMWSAGSGHFGTKLRGLGIDDVVFTGRAEHPTLLHITPGPDGPVFDFLDATDLAGRMINDRVRDLHGRYPEAHFAVVGPAAEQYEAVRYAAIAVTTDNQLESGDPKARFCARGGFGGVMGSKNLWAIAAEGPDPGRTRGLRDINKEINLGEGSARYRDLPDDRGGTWRTMKMMQAAQSLPEFNFTPSGTDASVALLRPSVEAGPFVVKAEGCYLCGIKCHKNVYDEVGAAEGEAGGFRAKVDFEPITLLSSNLGIFDPDPALSLIELSDELGMDSISLGVTIGYAMEYNRRNTASLGGGIEYGDVGAVVDVIHEIAAGRLVELGQGVKRLADQTGESGYAMHSKGVEYPAYQPQTNPGFAWALAGGHMSMRTFFLFVIERETSVDYWVDAITNRGPLYLMDDITGLCKFANATPALEAEALGIAAGLAITEDELVDVVMRTFLRGYAVERRRGFAAADYVLPAEAHEPMVNSTLPYFNTPEFFAEVQAKVIAELDHRATAAGYL